MNKQDIKIINKIIAKNIKRVIKPNGVIIGTFRQLRFGK